MKKNITARIGLHFVLGVLFGLTLLFGGMIIPHGRRAPAEPIPVSARDNPASYKPIYKRQSGWYPIPIGGGYRSGK
jgi:hypothetical protein